LEIYNVQGNQNRKTPYRLPRKKICDYAKSDKYFYKNLVAASNLPPADQCPAVPKVKKPFFSKYFSNNFFFFKSTQNQGNYTARNYLLDASEFPKNFNGKFLIIIAAYVNGKVADTINLYFELNRFD
jgi:hypothetical protein